MPEARTPVVLIVRDGWGRNPHPEHDAFNAVKLARTPRCDALLRDYAWTLIHTSGEDVGLPEGTMGNSEVGHQNLGAGRIIFQDSVRITRSIRDGGFFENAALVEAVERAKEPFQNEGRPSPRPSPSEGRGGFEQRGRYVHLMGIASDAGVHGLLEHLYACLELCKRRGQDKVAIHLFTDGRDTGPFTGIEYVRRIEAKAREIGVGTIASVIGRYFAMDRDNRWERVKKAYDLLTGHNAEPVLASLSGALKHARQQGPRTEADIAAKTFVRHFDTAGAAVRDYYDHPLNESQRGDEFVTPRTVGDDPAATRVRDGDSVIFYNYRGDRPREITRAFVLPDEAWAQVKASPDSGERGFERGPKLDLLYVTLAQYDEALGPYVRVAFPKPPPMEGIAGEHLSDLGKRQFRAAETEKFPHVTFFFNDYREEPFPGESRQMAQSPKVATYDLKPEMSAGEVTDAVLARLAAEDCEDFILVNFANGDMVGHTGNLEAAVRAVETVDACVGRLVDATLGRAGGGGSLVVTADHGNAEQMWDPKNDSPHTAHTTYDVECIVVDPRFAGEAGGATGDPARPSERLRRDGRLADVMPTVLQLMDLPKHKAMKGESLVRG